MENSLNEHLKNLIKYSNSYTKTNNLQDIDAIYSEYISFFDISNVEIWKYNEIKKEFTLLNEESRTITINTGLSYKAINRKSPVYSNHILSEKEYDNSVDNSSNAKIKSILISPVYHNDRLLGLIYFYRNINNKKAFASKDTKEISLSTDILSAMLQNIFYEEKTTKKELTPSPQPNQNINSKQNTPKQSKSNKEQELLLQKEQILQEKQSLESEKQQILQEKQSLESEKQQILQEKQSLESEYQQILQEKQSLESEYQQILQEKQSLESEYQQILQEKQSLESEKNKILIENENIKRKHKFLENFQFEKENSCKTNELIKKIYLGSKNNKLLMTLFELTFFIEDFTNIPTAAEEILKKSKLVELLIAETNLKKTIQNNEKHRTSIIFSRLVDNCNTILELNNQISMQIDQKMPMYLVFNALLVESILTRFLIKVSEFLRKDESIIMSIDFTDKELHIKLEFHVKQEKKLTSLFQSNKDFLYDNKLIDYKLNTKLLDLLGGKIHTSYQNDVYLFKLKVPALIIKI